MIRKHPYTMLELMTAMAVLLIFMLALMQFFTASQDMMGRASDKTEQYERARIAMDLIASDLQSLYYAEGHSTRVVQTGSNLLAMAIQSTDAAANGNSPLMYRYYSFDANAQTLSVSTYSSADSWNSANLYSSGYSFDPPTDAKKQLLIEGVTSFTSSQDPASAVMPDKVTVTMELLDTETMRTIESTLARETALDNKAKADDPTLEITAKNRSSVYTDLPSAVKTEADAKKRTFTKDFSIDY